MRRLWLCLTFTCAAAVSGACGDGAAQEHAPKPQGGAGSGGTTGGAAVSASGSAGKSSGGVSNGGGSGGSVAAGGSGGSVAASSGAGAGGGDDMSVAGNDGSAGLAAGGAPSNGGETSAAGDSAGGNGSAGAASDCNVTDPDRLIFVSSELYTGALGGLTGADSKCQALADLAGLCGSYKAWLSDDTGEADARLTHATGNYVLRSGQIVANDWSDLTSGKLQHAINLTEKNAAAPVGTVKCVGGPIPSVWTGTTSAGNGTGIPNRSCSNWSSASYTPGAIFGNANATNSAWSGACQITAVCQSTAALYCVQQ